MANQKLPDNLDIVTQITTVFVPGILKVSLLDLDTGRRFTYDYVYEGKIDTYQVKIAVKEALKYWGLSYVEDTEVGEDD